MDSFIVLPGKRLNNNAQISAKRERILDICDGVDDSYKTEHAHIVKLCRTCITDICNELTEIINWNVACYKKYIDIKKQLENGECIIGCMTEMIRNINLEISNNKYFYNRYNALLQELRKKKLYSKACILC